MTWKKVLTFVPQKDGRPGQEAGITATVTVSPTGRGNFESLSDSITKPSVLVDKKFKVLVVDSLPRYDFKYLQRALLRDRRVEAKFYLTEGTNRRCAPGRRGSPSSPAN